jgi:Dipeptidyl aminopeptidases/acylaminoacyl-peptidases
MEYYHNAYAMNQYLASKGYTVLSVNYRLGIMYGRAFREPPKSVWRGASEYQDVVAGAKFLQTLDNVDPQRIGLWGGSYGGFLTAMGLARNSDIFKAGVDFHGVHDWAIFLPCGPITLSCADIKEARELAFKSSPGRKHRELALPRALCSWRRRSQRAVPANHRSGRKTARPKRRVRELIIPDEIHDLLRWSDWVRSYKATADFFDRKLAATPQP